jgi:transposase
MTLAVSSHSGPPPAKCRLNFSYRLHPTPEQEVWLGETSEQVRHWWNALVGEQKHAHRQIVSGHPEHTRAKLAQRRPKMTGMRAAKLAKLTAEHGGGAEAGVAALGLAVRHWTCSACSKSQDRDIGAAINIARRGIESMAQRDSGETTRLNARGSAPRNGPKVAARSASVQVPQQQRKPLARVELASSQGDSVSAATRNGASATARKSSRKPAVVQRIAHEHTQ